MSKLTKAQYKAHQEACKLIEKDRLNEDERWFVLENWQESARHVNSAAGAFFTPIGLARDFNIEVTGPRILDLCAGIGALAFMAWNKSCWGREPVEITCVEINPDYLAVGRKILPEARWIEASVFDLPADLGHFDCVISNPPFGGTPRTGSAPRYTGRAFEYHVVDIASDLGDYGVFILPQQSAPFRYSGQPHYRVDESDAYRAFRNQTCIELAPNCGIDTEYYRSEWRGTSPATEIVVADFAEARERRAPKPVPAAIASEPVANTDQLDLFGEAA